MTDRDLLRECKLQLEYLNEKFKETGTTNALLTKIDAQLNVNLWDGVAKDLMDQFGESLIEEDRGEDDPLNWWLQDLTVGDMVDFIQDRFLI